MEAKLTRPDPRGPWIAAHPDTVREVLESDACHVRALRSEPIFPKMIRFREDAADLRKAIGKALASLDVEREANEAARLLIAGGPAHVAFLIAHYTLGRLSGVPEEDLPALASAAARFVAGNGEPPVLPEGGGPLAKVAHEDRRANEIALFFQAQDGVAGLIGNSLVALAREPTEDLRALVERTAVSDPAIVNTRRFITRETVIAGQRVAPNDVILLMLSESRLPFGHGKHACPGRSLALTIATAGVRAIVRAGHSMAREVTYRESPNARIPDFRDMLVVAPPVDRFVQR